MHHHIKRHIKQNPRVTALSIHHAQPNIFCYLQHSCRCAMMPTQRMQRICLSICRAINTSKTFDKQTRRLIGLQSENLAGLLTFGIGNTTEVFYFPGSLELTKIWLKI
jgi:hypothetical protein